MMTDLKIAIATDKYDDKTHSIKLSIGKSLFHVNSDQCPWEWGRVPTHTDKPVLRN